jgi:two-component system chemotaxis sensor kinase CheA
MNEFIEQFLIEARELVEQATGDLLALEEQPSDAARLDSAFRAFHTLKGSAGIVDFDAMGRALHAAEDMLARVRAGDNPVTPTLIGDCLTCLDQVEQWLEEMQASGEPPTDAEPAADAIVARFAKAAPEAAPATSAPPPAAWRDALLAAHPEMRQQARTAIRYRPDPHCFFEGEDPLARMAALPGLLALDIAPDGDWPALADLDPFNCQLVLTALTGAPTDEVTRLLGPVAGQADIQALALRGDAGLTEAGRLLLEAQIQFLAATTADGFAGRSASAAKVAANVLRHAGRGDDASYIEKTAERAIAGADARSLITALEDVLAGRLSIAVEHRTDEAAPAPQDVATRALRVDVERIDALVRLTGELTVVKNALGHIASLAQDGADAAALAGRLKDQHGLLARLVDELQRSVLSIRVLPLRHVFQRFPRLVREMGASLDKPVRLATEGDDTEADKAVVEALFEPLLHVLRNAVDHGLEPAKDRQAAGKPVPAVLRLRAERRGEHVIVDVTDDGRGVDVDRVRQVAAARGVATAEALAVMTDSQIVDLIFAPGFSTAATVTGFSGRGVGMDVVRVAIERMGGRVQVDNRPGQGTSVRFVLPFTVMMTRLMTVEAGGQVFGVPLDSVVETVRVPRDRISFIGAAQAFVLRSRTLPLCDLAQALGAAPAAAPPDEATVVVARAAGQLCGLEVDRVGERLDVMLKPMDGLLSGMPGVAGTTLLGDGRVLIVLDLEELLQ